MPSAELAPASHLERQENALEQSTHFRIPGFETLKPEQQRVFLLIPTAGLDRARPMIEAEIRKRHETLAEKAEGQADIGAGRAELVREQGREVQARDAIETFHRAKQGDKEAKKDLRDHKKEMFGEDPSDEEIFQQMLENESSDPFDGLMGADVGAPGGHGTMNWGPRHRPQ